MKVKLFANSENTLFITGSNFRVIESDQAIKAVFNGGFKSQTIESIERGMSFAPQGGFNEVRLLSPVDQTIEIESTLGALTDNRLSGVVDVSNKPFSSLSGLSPVTFDTNSKTIAGNGNRRELHINADSANAGLIFLGASAAGSGLPIEAGQTVVLQINGDLNLYADTINDKVNLCEVV